MNNFPSWWDKTITLYNKVTNNELKRVDWYRHVITNCFYSHKLESVIVGKIKLESDISVCRIPVSDMFMGRKEWLKLSDEDKHQYFTLCSGDIIVEDEIDFEIDERKQGRRSSDLIKDNSEWPGCFTIETVNINVGGGRGNEHYHVKGK